MCWDTEVFGTEVSNNCRRSEHNVQKSMFDSDWKEKEIIQGMCAEFSFARLVKKRTNIVCNNCQRRHLNGQ